GRPLHPHQGARRLQPAQHRDRADRDVPATAGSAAPRNGSAGTGADTGVPARRRRSTAALRPLPSTGGDPPGPTPPLPLRSERGLHAPAGSRDPLPPPDEKAIVQPLAAPTEAALRPPAAPFGSHVGMPRRSRGSDVKRLRH